MTTTCRCAPTCSLGGATSDSQGGYQGNANVTSQLDDNNNVKGNGNNRFALRVTGAHAERCRSPGWEEMGIYANYPGASTSFNLVRVIPAAASKTLIITFFDVGDADLRRHASRSSRPSTRTSPHP